MGKVKRSRREAPHPPLGQNLLRPLQVFYDYQGLFGQLRENWSWGWAYLYAAAGLLITNMLTMSNAVKLVEARLQAANVPEVFASFDRNVILVSNLALPWITPLVQPFFMAVLMQFLVLFMGVQIRFSKLFSIAMHSFLPTYLIGQLLKGVLAVMLPPEMMLRISLSPAILLPSAMTGSWLYVILSTFDIFIVTSLILLGVGFAIVHRQSAKRGAICATAVYGLIFLQTVLLAPTHP